MTKRDQRKYKVVHIPTNTTTFHSSLAKAKDKAMASDGMLLIRNSPDEQYVFSCEYRYGRRK